jgi:hypothetical protein
MEAVVTREMRRAAVLVVLVSAVALVAPVAAGAASGGPYVKGLITAGDVPAGWTATTADTTGDAATTKDIAQCVGQPVVKKKSLVTGKDLVDPTGKFRASSSLAVYASPAVAKKQFKTYQSSKYAPCAQKHFETTPLLEGGPLPTSVDVQKVTVKRSGDRNVAYGAQVDIPNSDGTTLTITSVQVAVLRGKVIARYQFDGQGTTSFDQATGEGLLAKVDKRLDKASL